MRELHVDVRNKIATYNARDGVIVCGNNDYKIKFSFDEEWSEYPTKTARFIWRGRYYDQEFTGDECQVPIINDTTKLTVGVYVGELKTTTPAKIPCLISILCGEPEIVDENVKEYRDKAQEAAEQAVRAAAVLKNPTIDVVEIEGGHRLTIHDVDGDKPFYVMNGGKDGVGIAKAEINANGELVLTYTNGNTANLGKVVGGSGSGLTDEQRKQFDTLVQWHADSTYTPMTVTIKQPSVRTYEIGSRQDLTFKWEFSEEVSSVTFNGYSQKAERVGEADVNNITSSGSYEVIGIRKDGKKEQASDKVSIYFYNKYYFGCAPDLTGDVDISTFIRTNLTLRTGWVDEKPKIEETPFVATNQYIWYACPVDYAPSSFKMNGFNGGFKKVRLVEFTNGSKHTEDYYLYRSVESGLGSIEIQVL